MEPSSVEDGNSAAAISGSPLDWKLQWSRPQLRTETSDLPVFAAYVATASMEPSSVEDGNLVRVFTRAATPAAASMEPSSVEDGNMPGSEGAMCRVTGLQWSRPQLRTETLQAWRGTLVCEGFNGAVLS